MILVMERLWTVDGVSCLAITLVCLFVAHSVWLGHVNLLHLHHETFRTHKLNTVAAGLSLLLTVAAAGANAQLLDMFQRSARLGGRGRLPRGLLLRMDDADGVPGPWDALILHAAAYLLAHLLAVAYKVCVILYKVRRYRMLTAKGLTGEGRAAGARPRRILIIHASVGSGHKRAAQALCEAMEAQLEAEGKQADGTHAPPPVIETLDIIDTQEWFLRTVYKKGFMTLVTKDWGAAFIGLMFDKSNTTSPGIRIGQQGFVQTLLEEAFMLTFVEYVFKFAPDVIVNTHFLPLKIVAHMREPL